MARLEADLTTFTLASDYDPAHYNWTKDELAALGDYKATAEVIKKRLEDNGKIVEEMYVIKHEGEKKADSKSGEHYKGIDETNEHYHILVKFVEKQGATLKEIAKYIGVRPEIIEKLDRGGHSYHNMLAYLIHFKDIDKITYPPQNVVTLAGTDYMNHFNEYEKMWERGREIKARKGGKTRDCLFREAMGKLDRGELIYNELALTKEYCGLLTDSNYQKKLFTKSKLVMNLAKIHCQNMKKMIENMEINSWEQIEESEQFKLLQSYGYTQELKDALETALKNGLRNDLSNLLQGIIDHRINLPYEDIEACAEYRAICRYYKEDIEATIRSQAEREYSDLYYAIANRKITFAEAKASGKYTYAYLLFKDDIEKERMPYHKPNR